MRSNANINNNNVGSFGTNINNNNVKRQANINNNNVNGFNANLNNNNVNGGTNINNNNVKRDVNLNNNNINSFGNANINNNNVKRSDDQFEVYSVQNVLSANYTTNNTTYSFNQTDYRSSNLLERYQRNLQRVVSNNSTKSSRFF